MNNFRRPPRLLLQYGDLLPRRIGGLTVLQKIAHPRMLVNGLFSSCATPPIIAPMAASRSLCTTCCSNFFSRVISRTEMIAPAKFCYPRPKSWLAEARMVCPIPSLRRASVFRRLKRFRAGKPRHGTARPVPENCPVSRKPSPQQVLAWTIPTNPAPRTDERVTLLQVDHQDQIRKALQQPPPNSSCCAT